MEKRWDPIYNKTRREQKASNSSPDYESLPLLLEVGSPDPDLAYYSIKEEFYGN